MTQPLPSDPFTQRTLSDAQKRFLDLRERHRRESDRLLAKMLAEEFTDWELNLLNRCSFLSPHDKQVLRRIGRVIRRLARVS